MFSLRRNITLTFYLGVVFVQKLFACVWSQRYAPFHWLVTNSPKENMVGAKCKQKVHVLQSCNINISLIVHGIVFWVLYSLAAIY